MEDIRVGSWELAADGRVVAIDRDPQAVERASWGSRDRRSEFMSGAYDEVLWEMVEEDRRVDAVLFDLGLSSYQIDEPERGFSYVREGPLDMRMDPRSGISAAEYLNTVEAEDPSEFSLVTGTCRVERRGGSCGR